MRSSSLGIFFSEIPVTLQVHNCLSKFRMSGLDAPRSSVWKESSTDTFYLNIPVGVEERS